MPRNKDNARKPLVGGVHGVRLGSLHHEVLLVLEHSALSCAELAQTLAVMIRPSAAPLTPHSMRKRALVPMRDSGLLTHDRDAQTWRINAAGRTMLRALEDFAAGVTTDADADANTEAEAAPTPGKRRAAAANSAGTANTSTSSASPWDGTAARDRPWLDAYATKGQPRRGLGNADRRPPVVRAGADAAARLPSRIGQRLEWPDGRQASASAADATAISGTAATR
jgi:hypothetical protein